MPSLGAHSTLLWCVRAQLGLVDDVVPAGVDADAHVAAFLKPFLKASHATGPWLDVLLLAWEG